jgi:hypothetical protein
MSACLSGCRACRCQLVRACRYQLRGPRMLLSTVPVCAAWSPRLQRGVLPALLRVLTTRKFAADPLEVLFADHVSARQSHHWARLFQADRACTAQEYQLTGIRRRTLAAGRTQHMQACRAAGACHGYAEEPLVGQSTATAAFCRRPLRTAAMASSQPPRPVMSKVHVVIIRLLFATRNSYCTARSSTAVPVP